MSVGSPTAGTWSSSQWRPDNEFETDRPRSNQPVSTHSWIVRRLTPKRLDNSAFETPPFQVVLQQHLRLPSVHLPPDPSLLMSSTAWNAGQHPPTTKVCGFRLPQMGNLRLPPTSTNGRRGNARRRPCSGNESPRSTSVCRSDHKRARHSPMADSGRSGFSAVGSNRVVLPGVVRAVRRSSLMLSRSRLAAEEHPV